MEIEDKLNELDFDQACELCGLIYLSYTKSTTVLYQRDKLSEWGFSIPRELVSEVDELPSVEQMLQAIKLSTKLVKEIEFD